MRGVCAHISEKYLMQEFHLSSTLNIINIPFRIQVAVTADVITPPKGAYRKRFSLLAALSFFRQNVSLRNRIGE